MTEAEFIRVTARVRPASTTQERIVIVRDGKNLCFNPSNPKHFTFDSVFGEGVTQDQVFDDIGSRIIDGCVDGYNGTIFAYGQTGSGKTHTMFGPSDVENVLLDYHERGLLPRACDALFSKLCTRAAEKGENYTYEVSCRFVELYNEEFYDLLSGSQQKLSIRSDSKSVQLLGVSEHRVQSSIDMMRVLEVGLDARRTAETAMNRESSRSHAIFIVDVKTEELVNTIVNKKSATLNLVDLAGSERQTQAKTIGERFKEAVNINLSLTVLGRVIRTLSDSNRRDNHIPYRESKLTHILRDSLGGNSKTAVIVNIHPEKCYYSETLSSLQFAAACRKIENRVYANEDLTGDTVMAYKCEIGRLREELRLIEEKTRSELGIKMSALEDELKNWRETAISREKALVKAQIQCDFFSAQLASRMNEENGTQSHDEVMREALSRLWARIDFVETIEDLTKIQLENDLSSARSELYQLQKRYDCAEAARKSLNEKYSNVLEGCDETFLVSPLHNLSLNLPHRYDEKRKTLAQRKKERRQTLFTPAAGNSNRKSRAFRPVIFEENEDGDAQTHGDIEQDEDMREERELLRLEMDNNRLSQIIFEKETAIKDIYEKQKNQSKQWMEEKELFIQTESLLKARVESLKTENCSLIEDMKELKHRAELFSAKLCSSNDEKCRIEQTVESLQSEKLDLEERLQVVQNENERLLTELGEVPKLETDISELRFQLSAAREDNYNLQVRNEDVEKECHSHLTDAFAHKLEYKNELVNNYEDLKKNYEQLQENNAKLKMEHEKEMNKLRRRHFDELNNKENIIELEQNAHQKTKQQFFSYRNTMQETFDRKLAELQETFSNTEKRLTMDMTEKDQQIVQLQVEKELLLRKCDSLDEVKRQTTQNEVELEKAKRELTLLRNEKAEADRALTELVGHNNHKQKLSYMEKIRFENHNLKMRNSELEARTKRCTCGRANPGQKSSHALTRSQTEVETH